MTFEVSYLTNKTSQTKVLKHIDKLIMFLEMNANHEEAREQIKALEDLEKSVKRGRFKPNLKVA